MKQKADRLGAKIKKRREEADLSLAELAENAEISKSYLWKLERDEDEVRPSGKSLYRIANALGTTMSDLLGREILAEEPVEIPIGLKRFAAKHRLTPPERRMLAQINFRGRRPETEDDWAFLWNAIQRSIPARRPRKAAKGSAHKRTQG